MRVCILTTVHTTYDTRVFHREAKSLVEAGFDVRLIVQYDRPQAIMDGVRIIGLPTISRRWSRVQSGWRAFRLALDQHADAYHLHDPELIPWGILLRLLTAKPVIYDVHEHYPDAIRGKQWLPPVLRKFVARLFDHGERLASRFFSALIVADESIRGRFQPSQKPVVLLHNFPSRGAFNAVHGQSALQPREHETQLVYVGAISGERGIWLMLDLMRTLITEHQLDVGLWIAGRFGYPHEQREFERQLEADADLKSRVTWLGTVPYEQLPRLLSGADIGLVPLQPIPKFEKNIPTKQFEYMAAGLPIVASDLAPIRRFVPASRAGRLAVPDDARSHADEIAYLVGHPSEAGRLGENGRAAFEAEYNWDSEAKKLIDLYHCLVP
jgi:glycosyltransferase involved in cell wall biosynthesis